MNRRTPLLAIGAIITILGSLAIEISVLLLLTPIPTDLLVDGVLAGIGLCSVGAILLWLGRVRSGT